MSELTLCIIKPDAVSQGHAGEIISILEKDGFRIRAVRMLRLTREQAEGFYAVHREKGFFPGLVEFMTEGPVIVMALEREDAIRKLREVMGATNPAHAALRPKHRAQRHPRLGCPRHRGVRARLLL
jgi:nucleoside-diphosphate kinase